MNNYKTIGTKRLRDSVGCAYLVVKYVEVLSERDNRLTLILYNIIILCTIIYKRTYEKSCRIICVCTC